MFLIRKKGLIWRNKDGDNYLRHIFSKRDKSILQKKSQQLQTSREESFATTVFDLESNLAMAKIVDKGSLPNIY